MDEQIDVDLATTTQHRSVVAGPAHVYLRPVIHSSRPAYTQVEFDEIIKPVGKKTKPLKQLITEKYERAECSGLCMKRVMKRVFPFLHIFQGYTLREDFGWGRCGWLDRWHCAYTTR